MHFDKNCGAHKEILSDLLYGTHCTPKQYQTLRYIKDFSCSFGECSLRHISKNFITRHMKEVHKYKRTPLDVTDCDSNLKAELSKV